MGKMKGGASDKIRALENKIRELKQIAFEAIEKMIIASREGRLLEDKLKSAEEKLIENRCCFNIKYKCPFHQTMKGIIDMDHWCINCQHFDRQLFISKYYAIVYPSE